MSFHILCHLTFRVIWHSVSFHFSCHLTFRVIWVISVIIVIRVTKVIIALCASCCRGPVCAQKVACRLRIVIGRYGYKSSFGANNRQNWWLGGHIELTEKEKMTHQWICRARKYWRRHLAGSDPCRGGRRMRIWNKCTCMSCTYQTCGHFIGNSSLCYLRWPSPLPSFLMKSAILLITLSCSSSLRFPASEAPFEIASILPSSRYNQSLNI